MKSASSQAAWALLTEGVTQARVELHRLQHLMTRSQMLVDGSDEKEHIYQVAGDIILAVPERMERIRITLDRTALALSKMGETFLTARLPLSEKLMVDEAVESTFGKAQLRESAMRVARRFELRRRA